MIQIFKALSEESRLRILSLLVNSEELCVCEVEEILGMTQSNASRHLTILKNCGILISYKKAQWAYYKLNDIFISENTELWEYLKNRLQKLNTFCKDCEKLGECKSKDLCSCRSKEVSNE